MSDDGREATEALLRRFVEALNRSDWDGALAFLDEDVVHDRPGGGREIGREDYRADLARRAATRRETIGDVVVMTSSDGAHAALDFTLRGEEHGEGGRSYSEPAGLFLEVADGRITRISERAGPPV